MTTIKKLEQQRDRARERHNRLRKQQQLAYEEIVRFEDAIHREGVRLQTGQPISLRRGYDLELEREQLTLLSVARTKATIQTGAGKSWRIPLEWIKADASDRTEFVRL